jgi:hypothetical protein
MPERWPSSPADSLARVGSTDGGRGAIGGPRPAAPGAPARLTLTQVRRGPRRERSAPADVRLAPCRHAGPKCTGANPLHRAEGAAAQGSRTHRRGHEGVARQLALPFDVSRYAINRADAPASGGPTDPGLRPVVALSSSPARRIVTCPNAPPRRRRRAGAARWRGACAPPHRWPRRSGDPVARPASAARRMGWDPRASTPSAPRS